MADAPVLAPDVSYYQRLLARDQSEALDLIDQYVQSNSPGSVYDALLLPALNYAERDRFEGRLSTDEEVSVIDATQELISDVAVLAKSVAASRQGDSQHATLSVLDVPTIFGYPANSRADELALRMLKTLLENVGVSLDIGSGHMMTSEIMASLRQTGYRIICIADLPPSAPSKTPYLIKKLHGSIPDLKIVVGRWAPSSLADDSDQALIDAGAHHVASTLLQSRDYLRQLACQLPQIPAEAAVPSQHESEQVH
jgi:hypothetical protein